MNWLQDLTFMPQINPKALLLRQGHRVQKCPNWLMLNIEDITCKLQSWPSLQDQTELFPYKQKAQTWNSAFLKTDLIFYINWDSSLSVVIDSVEILKGKRKKCSGKIQRYCQSTNLIKIREKMYRFFSQKNPISEIYWMFLGVVKTWTDLSF